ncbi:MAG: GTP-binding protein [Clostridia bacterium]|nr:GTP-binding protein [Clostridia bacterium]
MTKIDIISGFLGAGKTTLIKKLISESYKGEKLVLVENEFGEIGVDGGFMKDAGIEVSEINSGCICCSLVGDFRAALAEVVEKYAPDRIIIEPSGVGKLSDVIRAAQGAKTDGKAELNSFITVADCTKAKMYMKNFGEFFNDQIENAGCIILSRTQKMDEAKLETVVALLREHNPEAVIITTPWDAISGDVIRSAMEKTTDLAAELMEAVKADLAQEEEAHEHHHHHHHDDDEECCCHHHDEEDEHEHHHHHDEEEECCCHHHDDEDEHEHHHHHDDDEECCCHHHDDEEEHEHHHHHDDDEECCCHYHHDEEDEHEHHHHHHHHADEVFTNWGKETPKKFAREALDEALKELSREDSSCGVILRAKGILQAVDGSWMQFDLTPGEYEIREGSANYTGMICVIGTKLDEEKLAALFGL